MNIQSRLSGHWTDEQIIDHLYCGTSASEHLVACDDCARRVSAMRDHRRAIEDASGLHDANPELLAIQRRRIYAQLSSEIKPFWPAGSIARWASAVAVVVALGCSAFFVENSNSGLHPVTRQQTHPATISDTQLAREVGQLADAYEPEPTGPLQALFAE